VLDRRRAPAAGCAIQPRGRPVKGRGLARRPLGWPPWWRDRADRGIAQSARAGGEGRQVGAPRVLPHRPESTVGSAAGSHPQAWPSARPTDSVWPCPQRRACVALVGRGLSAKTPQIPARRGGDGWSHYGRSRPGGKRCWVRPHTGGVDAWGLVTCGRDCRGTRRPSAATSPSGMTSGGDTVATAAGSEGNRGAQIVHSSRATGSQGRCQLPPG
jgi:hypothetical protein